MPSSRVSSCAFFLPLAILVVLSSKGRACEGLGGLVSGAGGRVLVRLTVTRGAWEDSEEEPVTALDEPGDRNEIPEPEVLIEATLGAFDEPDVVLDFEEPSDRKARQEQ